MADLVEPKYGYLWTDPSPVHGPDHKHLSCDYMYHIQKEK